MVHSDDSDTVDLSLDNTTPAVGFISHWLQLKTVFFLQFITNFYDFVFFLFEEWLPYTAEGEWYYTLLYLFLPDNLLSLFILHVLVNL